MAYFRVFDGTVIEDDSPKVNANIQIGLFF